MESMPAVFERLVDAVRYPLDDPDKAIVAILALAVAGLLVAILLIAVASPSRRGEGAPTGTDPSSSEPDSSAD